MSFKSNSTTEVSKEKLQDLCEVAASNKKLYEDYSVRVQQICGQIKSCEDLEGEEAEKLIGIVENIGKLSSAFAQKFAKLVKITDDLLEYVAAVSTTTKSKLDEHSTATAKSKMQVNTSGNK